MSDFNMPPGVSARDIPGQDDARDDGGAAFPVPPTIFTTRGDMSFASQGMTLRDYFAAKTLQAVMVNSSMPGLDERNPATLAILDQVAACSYIVADAMLKARNA